MINWASLLGNVAVVGQSNRQTAANVNTLGGLVGQGNTQLAGNSANITQVNL